MSIITSAEFAHFFSSCKPPTGWGKFITVALSGGPDSLCLLFLLHRHLSTIHPQISALRSITIDHGLQSTSLASARRTHARAVSMGVPNIVLPAVWDTKHSTPRRGTAAIEEAARKARYEALWRGMWEKCRDDDGVTQTLMFAHHADDQLETVIMRMMRGTGTYGMGGMRAIRRWGMDGERLRGMRTWICRPLLGVSKERILATCNAHDLSYEQDVTNFMSDLTVRNAIRHALSQPHITPKDEKIRGAIEHVRVLAGGSCKLEHMRGYVREMAERVVRVDQLVNAYLHANTRPSPPSTLLLVPPDLSTALPLDVQSALVHRILRYVSSHPWGSPESEAGRRSESIRRIVQRVLHSPTGNKDLQPFVAGAQVLWTPVAIRPDGTIRRWVHELGGAERGWLASRQPPLAAASRALTVEVDGMSLRENVLWDNRFLVDVRAQERKDGWPRVMIRPKGRLVLPEIVRIGKGGEEERAECRVQFVRELDAI